MKRTVKIITLIGSGVTLLQFGGCIENVLADVFFAVGPFLL